MAKYKIEFPTGIAGKPDDLIRRIASIPAVYDVAAATVVVTDGDKAPAADYINALFGEYNGKAIPMDDDNSDDTPEYRKSDKA